MTHENVVPCPSCEGGWKKRGRDFGYIMCTACVGTGFIQRVSTEVEEASS